jgi:hypothetical protein
MKRLLRKALRWAGILLATLIVLLLAFYAEEDWRGARDWAACQRDLAAKGETLDLRQLAPPGKPEDDLSKVPIFAEKYALPPIHYEGLFAQENPKPTRLTRVDIFLGEKDYAKHPKSSGYLAGQPLDLGEWQKFYRSSPAARLAEKTSTLAQDVLQALNQFDPEWNEVQAALSNPNAYWPTDYERPFDSYLGGITSMIELARVLPLKAVAHLENNQADLAAKDYLFSFQLSQPLVKGGMLIHYLILVGVRAIDDAILWEGLHRHAWNEEQLREMESALASTDFLAVAARCFRIERACTLQTMKMTQARDQKLYQDLKEEGSGAIWYYFQIRPNGWLNQDRLAFISRVQHGIDGISIEQGTINPLAFDEQQYEATRSSWRMFYNPISTLVGSNFVYTGPKIAKAETYRRLARLACRLEEYRLAHHNQYPDKLDDLPDLPAHLNQEVLSTQPLQYHRQGDGYTLYSLGWNQKDNGGTYNPDPKQGNWPWPSP